MFKVRLLGKDGQTGKNFAPQISNLADNKVNIKFYVELSYDMAYWHNTVVPRWVSVFGAIATSKGETKRMSRKDSRPVFSFPMASDDPQRQDKKWSPSGNYKMDGSIFLDEFNQSKLLGTGMPGDRQKPYPIYIASAVDQMGQTFSFQTWFLNRGEFLQKTANAMKLYYGVSVCDLVYIDFVSDQGDTIISLPLVEPSPTNWKPLGLALRADNKGQPLKERDGALVTAGRNASTPPKALYFIPLFSPEGDIRTGELSQFCMFQFDHDFSIDDTKNIAKIVVTIKQNH